MTSLAHIESFQKAKPHIKLLTPDAPGYTERRETRGQYGQERQPLGIAIPQDAAEVASIVRWARSSGVEMAVRSGGNDYFGRNVADGGLVIDMRDISFVEVAADRKTATVGGGIITKGLVKALNAQGLMAPTGNTWSVGYIAWATQGGYGPMANKLGMGYEGIVGARLVNAGGDIVEATEDMLEGIRGMGGNLGIITELTIKVYPGHDILPGMILLDPKPENIEAVIAVEAKLDVPAALTFHNFLMKMAGPTKLMILYTWTDPDHDKGKQYWEHLLALLPKPEMSKLSPKSIPAMYEEQRIGCLPYGAHRSFFVKTMSRGLVQAIEAALPGLPTNVSWSMAISSPTEQQPANCFGGGGGGGSHIFLSFADMVATAEELPAAKEWADGLQARLRASGDAALMEGSYAPMTPPEARTVEQVFGDKWARARELKDRYDGDNVWKYCVPTF